MNNTTWPDGSPRDPRFRMSKTGAGWVFDGPEGPRAVGDWIDARQVQRAMEADEAEEDAASRAGAAAEAEAEQHDANPPPTASEDDLLRAYDQAILANEAAQAETMATQHRLDAARQQWERRHYIDRDRKQGMFAPKDGHDGPRHTD